MNKFNRHQNFIVIITHFLEIFMKIEVKDNNIEQALRVLKRKLQRDGFFKVVNLKVFMKNLLKRKKEFFKKILKELKSLNKLKNRI